jgi:translation initiation factor RLI1
MEYLEEENMKLRNENLELKEKSNVQSALQHVSVLNQPQLQNFQLNLQLQNPQFQNP